jgi:hypothetical protein
LEQYNKRQLWLPFVFPGLGLAAPGVMRIQSEMQAPRRHQTAS